MLLLTYLDTFDVKPCRTLYQGHHRRDHRAPCTLSSPGLSSYGLACSLQRCCYDGLSDHIDATPLAGR